MAENSDIKPKINLVLPKPSENEEAQEIIVPAPNGLGRGKKLEVYDWLKDIPNTEAFKMVEVQFKNTRKGYYLNSNNIELKIGDVVAVESSPGHDIGEVTLTGRLVANQMKKSNYRLQPGDQKRVYRVAKASDIEKYHQAKAKEHATMIRSREIAEDLGLKMKIGDVEYQGDGNKAIFYYIADERVDFRQLIKVLAEEFRVRIEMKQIGARQEAGRIGGIGPCGRELCCSSWMSNFVSVGTSAARFQDISLNPQKLAGQCSKLKCCLNYEVDQYVEANKKLPSKDVVLETKDGSFFHFKTDIFSGMMTYSSSKTVVANLITIPKERVFEVIRMNKAGEKPEKLTDGTDVDATSAKPVFKDLLEDESITRFDKTKKKRRKPNRNNSSVQKTGTLDNREGGEKNDDKKNNNNRRRRNNTNRDNRQQKDAQLQNESERPSQANNPNKGNRNNRRRPNNNRPRKELKKKDDKSSDD